MDQLDIFSQAIAAAQEGIKRAAEHAESDCPGWTERALDFLHEYAEKNERFPGFFVTAASEKDPVFPQPDDDRAWGGIYRAAARRGWIIDSGKSMKHPKRHACKAIVWTSLIYRP